MRLKQLIFLLILPLLFSCKEPVEEIIDLKDIIEGSDNYKEDDEVAAEIKVIDTLSHLVIPFNEKGFEFVTANEINKNLFPDRFGPISNRKIELVSLSDTVRFLQWNYSDSVKTMNAFYNWIDNFGEKGKSIHIGERLNFQKLPFIMFVGDTSLTFIESNSNLVYGDWELFCSKEEKMKNWNYAIEQRLRSKASWFTYTNNNKEGLKN